MNKIDFVLAWVDGADKEWLAERRKYNPAKGADNSAARYRDWENLQYWFRGVEKFAPWVNRIYFVTCGHIPPWLNTSHPKLKLIRHSDYMKPEYLPTFNINSIELNFHRIPELSEQFVYFNDDMFLLKPVYMEDFFKDEKPIDMLALQPDVANVDDPTMPYIYYIKSSVDLCGYYTKSL